VGLVFRLRAVKLNCFLELLTDSLGEGLLGPLECDFAALYHLECLPLRPLLLQPLLPLGSIAVEHLLDATASPHLPGDLIDLRVKARPLRAPPRAFLCLSRHLALDPLVVVGGLGHDLSPRHRLIKQLLLPLLKRPFQLDLNLEHMPHLVVEELLCAPSPHMMARERAQLRRLLLRRGLDGGARQGGEVVGVVCGRRDGVVAHGAAALECRWLEGALGGGLPLALLSRAVLRLPQLLVALAGQLV